MVEVITVFVIISGIIFFGFFAEFIFNKYKIPDVLLLIALGFFLGPYTLDYVSADSLKGIAPAFTSFALLFLLFDGAFNIDLVSFAKGIGKGMLITLFNFALSSAVITGIAYLFGMDIIHSLLLGFILGGISSAFVIPVIKNLKISRETYSILTLESAVTDVLCIVAALATAEIIALNQFNLNVVLSKIAALFAVAGFFGIIAGIIWIVIANRVLKRNTSYMLTIAYLLLLYTVTEYLGGNGAIATLFFGLVLRNSKQLTSLIKGDAAVSVTSPIEKLFYSQISFFLKTFFFVYIGILIDVSNTMAVIIGGAIAVALLILRNFSSLLTSSLPEFDRRVVNSIFARGLAAAVLAQLIIEYGIQDAGFISRVVVTAIIFSIILSSARIAITSRSSCPAKQPS